MSTDTSSSTGVWARIGQIAVIITAFWTVVQIYNYFTNKDAEITTTAEYGSFSPPDYITNELSKLDSLPALAEISKLLPSGTKSPDEVAFAIKQLFRGDKPIGSALVNDLRELDSYSTFTIKNSGNKEAQDIKIELPCDGVYSLNRAGQPLKVDKFDHVIAIGNLHPGNEVRLTTWNTVPLEEPYYRRHSRVSHTNGVVGIDFVPQLEGFEWLFHHYPLVPISLILGWTIFVAILAYHSGKGSPKHQPINQPQGVNDGPVANGTDSDMS